jgi:hypothetical protein
MKFSIKSRILKVGAITFTGLTVVISAQAYSDNDLILGFTTATSTGDLVVNLGQPAVVGVGGSTTVDLNTSGNTGFTNAAGLLAELKSLYGSMNRLTWGVVASHFHNATNGAIYSTVLHGAAAPPPGNNQFALANNEIGTVATTIDGTFTPINTAVVDPTAGTLSSWNEVMNSGGRSGTSLVTDYNNPNSTTSSTFSSGANTIQEDLYLTTYQQQAPVLLGTFTLGNDGSFKFTPSAGVVAPAATTLAASSVTAGTALLNASINPNGASTTVSFQYGTNTSYGSSTPVITLASGTTAVSTNAGVGGLLAGTTYHFRVVATNSAGPTLGSDMSFTTLAVTAPQLTSVTNGNGAFGFAFANTPGASFTVWGSTNLAKPFSQWANLGPASVVSPGQYRFVDAHATNGQLFYRVTAP